MWLHTQTDGNPLAIMELTALLTLGQVTGVEALPDAQLTAALLYRGGPTPSEPLTKREFRIASAVAGGATNRQIARDLGISPRTVEIYLARIYRKLGVRNRTQLADAMGLLHGGQPEPEVPKAAGPRPSTTTPSPSPTPAASGASPYISRPLPPLTARDHPDGAGNTD